ncbi:C3a anaphylatoxin chemotactic receptor-like [Paramisgurnus dabryanus]|uniref:C3a anaphylatoxin chemotactic receptor-like n=1 Tax=Paramisgurnus dabryanus TaxID=90735 RepID=UPI003CCF709C
MVGTTMGHQNLTELQTTISPNKMQEKSFSSIEIFMICIFFVTLVIGVIGNGLVIFVTSYKMKTTVNSIWFLNLAIADFLFITFLVYEIVVVFENSIYLQSNKLIAACWIFGVVLNIFASVFFLTVISVDRCLCTWFIVWVQNKRTLVKARIISVFVWILAICCSLPFGITEYVYKAENAINVMLSLQTYIFIMGFVIPFIIIASSYIAIGVRVIISVILAFFICWFPFHVQKLCFMSSVKYKWRSHKNLEAAEPFVTCLVYLNSCLNPILYVFMCDKFKVKLKKSLLMVLEAAFTKLYGLQEKSLHTLHSLLPLKSSGHVDGGHKPLKVDRAQQKEKVLYGVYCKKGDYGGRDNGDILGCAANQSVTAAEWPNATLSHTTIKLREFDSLCHLSSAGTSIMPVIQKK